MSIFRDTLQRALYTAFRWFEDKTYRPLIRPRLFLNSHYLNRLIAVDVYLPPDYYARHDQYFRVLFFNDGQDMEAIQLVDILEHLYQERNIHPIIVIGLHANDRRIYEYGTVGKPDYKNRGNFAGAYLSFFTEELLPHIHQHYRCHTNPEYNIFAGFSLGGLSAFDIVWNRPDIFGKTGVFSGSFWWRSEPFSDHDPDGHRIMHEIVRASAYKEGLEFWFEAGTHDETSDRNNNGIIDAIDDTLDLIKELEAKGYQRDRDITYVEVEGGEHNHRTWKEVLPHFLVWAFGKKN